MMITSASQNQITYPNSLIVFPHSLNQLHMTLHACVHTYVHDYNHKHIIN